MPIFVPLYVCSYHWIGLEIASDSQRLSFNSMNYPGLVGWRQQNFRLEFHVDCGGLHQMHAFSLI